MATRSSIASWFGYDVDVVSNMSAGGRSRLQRLAWLGLLPVVLIGCSAASITWLIEHSVPAAFAIGMGMALIVLNLLRLVVAGSGAAPNYTETRVRKWTPKPGPLAALCLLSAFFAQPVLILANKQSLDPEVDAYRNALVEEHRVQIQAPIDAAQRESLYVPQGSDAYRLRLSTCEFVALRLALIWRSPELPLLFTGTFCLLLMSPLLLGHLTHLGVLREYELQRWRLVRDALMQTEAATLRATSEALSAWPVFPVTHLDVVAAARSSKGASVVDG